LLKNRETIPNLEVTLQEIRKKRKNDRDTENEKKAERV